VYFTSSEPLQVQKDMGHLSTGCKDIIAEFNRVHRLKCTSVFLLTNAKENTDECLNNCGKCERSLKSIKNERRNNESNRMWTLILFKMYESIT
jgi:hypothetical protein